MRKPSVFAVLFFGVLVGCTSILGDFEVGPSSSGGLTESGTPCTQCGDKCVDTATDPANCGACGTVCNGGKTCQTSKCACTQEKAFCNNECVIANRMACGETCTPCQMDEICNAGCKPAPLAAFKTPPRNPTGWETVNGPLQIEVEPMTAPGTIYECRTGPAAKFSPTVPEWGPCDGDKGAGTIHKPKPDPATPEGTYRTEYRYRSDTYRSNTAALTYYVHKALDKVPTCPRAGQTNDGPHFTDEQYFAEAVKFASQNPGAGFMLGATFPAPKDPPARTDEIFLDNPWIKIPFAGIKITPNLFNGDWGPNNGNVTVETRSLRHKYVLSKDRQLLLVKRQYVHPGARRKDCTDFFPMGSNLGASYGPKEAGRGRREVACEALVLNSRGASLCLGVAKDAKIAILPIDTQVPGLPLPTTPNSTGTITARPNDPVIDIIATTTPPAVNNYIMFPINGAGGRPRVYKVNTVAANGFNNWKVTLAEPAQVLANTSGATWSRSGATPQPIFVSPNGFAKLTEDGHRYGAGRRPPLTAEPRTKCETPGCNTKQPWLTYLPP